eukprot:832340-Alexandrium_andersonii.AAC.1
MDWRSRPIRLPRLMFWGHCEPLWANARLAFVPARLLAVSSRPRTLALLHLMRPMPARTAWSPCAAGRWLRTRRSRTSSLPRGSLTALCRGAVGAASTPTR